jgi:hypothetical protein
VGVTAAVVGGPPAGVVPGVVFGVVAGGHVVVDAGTVVPGADDGEVVGPGPVVLVVLVVPAGGTVVARVVLVAGDDPGGGTLPHGAPPAPGMLVCGPLPGGPGRAPRALATFAAACGAATVATLPLDEGTVARVVVPAVPPPLPVFAAAPVADPLWPGIRCNTVVTSLSTTVPFTCSVAARVPV